MRSSNKTKDKLFKMNPNIFILSMQKNGMITSTDAELLNNIDDYIDSLDETTKNIVNIFKPFAKYNINYINYVNVFRNLDLLQLKNLYRFFSIKWNLIRKKTNIKPFEIKYDLQYIYSIIDYQQLLTICNDLYSEFVHIGDFHFLLFINTLHDYLAPNT